jgi:hypothetical protein
MFSKKEIKKIIQDLKTNKETRDKFILLKTEIKFNQLHINIDNLDEFYLEEECNNKGEISYQMYHKNKKKDVNHYHYQRYEFTIEDALKYIIIHNVKNKKAKKINYMNYLVDNRQSMWSCRVKFK